MNNGINFANCKRCKKILSFNNIGATKAVFCDKCKVEVLKEIELLNNIILENDDITIEELISETKVNKNTIIDYMNSGKIKSIKNFEIKKYRFK